MITLTQAQKDALKAAFAAYKTAANQALNAAANAQAKQDALKAAFDNVLATCRIPRAGEPGAVDFVEKVRVGGKVYSIGERAVLEVDDIVDAT
ncbi:MAG TPA: hypothetical protein PKV98_04500 [Burkholderiaceae bacterium]|nr:hypothetical protein [Burkholderiaceae bacterium]